MTDCIRRALKRSAFRGPSRCRSATYSGMTPDTVLGETIAVVANVRAWQRPNGTGLHTPADTLTVEAYRHNGNTVLINDPHAGGYWKSLDDLAQWVATKGYSA